MSEYVTPSGIVVRENRSSYREEVIAEARKTLNEIVDLYDIVEVIHEDDHSYVIASERGNRSVALAEPNMREIGHTGQTQYGGMMREEYNPKLRGKTGWILFDEMRRSDAAIRASLRIAKIPVLGARWHVQPVSSSAQDQKIAKFVWDCYTKYQSISWFQIQYEALLCLDYGWYSFEKVWMRREGQLVWQKWAPRHPLDHEEWEWDANGGPEAAWFYAPRETPGAERIPIQKLMVFTHDREGGDLEGISAIRSAYPHWYIKQNLYKIDAIQKERHGIGVPIIKLPVSFDKDDVRLANELGRNLRTNEKAHIVLPPGWEILFAKLEGQPVDMVASIDHHNQQIYNNVLAGFLNAATNTESGAEMFDKGSRFIADVVAATHNMWAIPELVRLNFGADVEPPLLKVHRLGDTVDWRTLSFAVRNLIGAKVIMPTPELEEWFREEMDLPPLSDEELRIAQESFAIWAKNMQTPVPSAPQAGLGNADTEKKGMPRQAPATNMQQGSNAGRSNTGQDSSGG